MAEKEVSFFEPVDETPLRDLVAENIRRAIDAGALKPGERLVEADIAGKMGISRAPVREAIRLLEQEGFLKSIPRKGTFVVELDRQDIEEIYSLRTVLEVLAINQALPRMTQNDIDKLKIIVDEMDRAAEAGDYSKLVQYDLDFHKYIVELADHKRLFEFWQQMFTQLRLFLALKDRIYENPSDVVETHKPLFEAICARDATLAPQLMGQHITEAGKLLLSYLENSTT